jgi:hypothetical protein
MKPDEEPTRPSEAPVTGLLALLFFATSTVLVLTEHFRELPSALAAFASARYIVGR